MNSTYINELNRIKSELLSAIREMESISYGVRHDFSGVGNRQCADCLNGVIGYYYSIYQKLSSIDVNMCYENDNITNHLGKGRKI